MIGEFKINVVPDGVMADHTIICSPRTRKAYVWTYARLVALISQWNEGGYTQYDCAYMLNAVLNPSGVTATADVAHAAVSPVDRLCVDPPARDAAPVDAARAPGQSPAGTTDQP